MNVQSAVIDEASASTRNISPSMAYKVWFIFILILLSAVVVGERRILSVMVQPLKHDLHLSDWDIGLFNLAFVLVYVIFSIPIGRRADSSSRRNLIAASAVMWSVGALVCGSAKSLTMMVAGQAGIGLGEAMTTSPTQSLITDTFPPKQRGTAFSLWLLGSSLGLFGGITIGGMLVKTYGWSHAFYIAAIPGLVLAPIAWLTIRDFRRGYSDGVSKDIAKQPPFWDTFKLLMKIRTLPFFMFSTMIASFVSMNMAFWGPAFLARTHHVESNIVRASLGLALMVGSLIGHLIGGPLSDFLSRKDVRAPVWIALFSGIASAGLGFLVFTVPLSTAFWVIAAQSIVSGMSAAPMIQIITTLAPTWARSTALAMAMVLINAFGLGLLPALVGRLSDYLTPIYGDGALQMALLFGLLMAVPASICCFIASTHYRKDHAAAMARLGPTEAHSGSLH
jgi:MFS family permease